VPFSLWPPSRTSRLRPPTTEPLTQEPEPPHPHITPPTSNLLPFAVLTTRCSARRARVSCPCSYLTSFCLPDALNRRNPLSTPCAFPRCIAPSRWIPSTPSPTQARDSHRLLRARPLLLLNLTDCIPVHLRQVSRHRRARLLPTTCARSAHAMTPTTRNLPRSER